MAAAVAAYKGFQPDVEPRGWKRCISEGQPIRRREGGVDDSYELIEGREDAIKCLVCGMTSHHPEDVRQKYCGNCQQFHEFLTLSQET